MSHFSQIKTQIRNRQYLEQALTELGIAWTPGPAPVRGYRGQTETADLVIAQTNGFDLGFSWYGEAYELVADLQYWQQPWSVDRFLSRVTQTYALQAILHTGSTQGFQVTAQERTTEGAVRLVLERWGG